MYEIGTMLKNVEGILPYTFVNFTLQMYTSCLAEGEATSSRAEGEAQTTETKDSQTTNTPHGSENHDATRNHDEQSSERTTRGRNEKTTMRYADGEKRQQRQNATTQQGRKMQPRCHQHNAEPPLRATSTTMPPLMPPPPATRTTMPRELKP